MKPGSILCDDKFVYDDGTIGRKILISLNDGSCGYYVVVKCTSKGTHKGITSGCQSTDRYPNFFLPRGCCLLTRDTWVGLNRFFEFDGQTLLNKHFRNELQVLGILSVETLTSLLECCIHCEDISKAQQAELIRTHDNLSLGENKT